MAQFLGMMPQKKAQPPWGKGGGAAPGFRARPGAMPPPRGKMPMMADGGAAMGAPAPIGGMDDAPPPAAGPGAGAPPPPDADQDNDMDSPVVKPEAVNYHDDPHSCQSCMYMSGDGQCSVLKMQVSPEGGCNAFEAKGAGGDDEMGGGMMPGEDAGDTGMGTSGGQQ